jgi:hypothetical protein
VLELAFTLVLAQMVFRSSLHLREWGAIAGMSAGLAAPQTYLLVVLGPVFFLLLQKSLQAGSLVAAQPALTLSNPVIAIVFGIVVFREQIHTGGWLALSVAGAAAIAACTVALTRSPLLQDDAGSGSDVAASEASRCSP